jgi:hypothetical protein
VVPDAVAKRRVVTGVERDQEEHHEEDQDPAHRTTRLVTCDNNTNSGEGQRDGESRGHVQDGQLMDENGEYHRESEQHEHQGAEGVRRCR